MVSSARPLSLRAVRSWAPVSYDDSRSLSVIVLCLEGVMSGMLEAGYEQWVATVEYWDCWLNDKPHMRRVDCNIYSVLRAA
jgi:hypothetical protein